MLATIAAAGIDHLCVGDHVSFFVGAGSDGLIAASTLLAAQEQLPVYVGLYLLPLRHPVLVARQLATIAQLAPGRLTLNAVIAPAPRPSIPLVVGGRSEAAVSRAARLGDGWLGIWVSPRRYADVCEQINRESAAAGRDTNRFEHALNVWCGFGTTHEAARQELATQMQDFYQNALRSVRALLAVRNATRCRGDPKPLH